MAPARVGGVGSGALDRRDCFRVIKTAGMAEVAVLRREGYAAALVKAAPEEADRLLARWGVTQEDLLGVVHSVTWRATRP